MSKYVKSVHFKKTVARISFLSKLWYFQYKSKHTHFDYFVNCDLSSLKHPRLQLILKLYNYIQSERQINFENLFAQKRNTHHRIENGGNEMLCKLIFFHPYVLHFNSCMILSYILF